MSVMPFDLANDQPGHVAGAQGELEGRLGPVLGEGAGPRARVRGWQEGLRTQVGCSNNLFCKLVLTKYFIFYTHCSGQYLGSFPPCWSTCSRTHHVARWLELPIVLQDHLQNLRNFFVKSYSFQNLLQTFYLHSMMADGDNRVPGHIVRDPLPSPQHALHRWATSTLIQLFSINTK